MRIPAMTELMRFLREGVTPAWAASGLERAAPAATVRAAGNASVCSLFSALQHSQFSVSLPMRAPWPLPGSPMRPVATSGRCGYSPSPKEEPAQMGGRCALPPWTAGPAGCHSKSHHAALPLFYNICSCGNEAVHESSETSTHIVAQLYSFSYRVTDCCAKVAKGPGVAPKRRSCPPCADVPVYAA